MNIDASEFGRVHFSCMWDQLCVIFLGLFCFAP